MHIDLANRRWTDEEFFAVREEVLSQWPTGREVDLDEAIEYCRKIPPEKNSYLMIQKKKGQGEIALDVAIGRGTLDETIEEITAMKGDLEPDEWSLFTDPYTRKCRFDQAQVGMDRSQKEGRSMLSGFPLVNYGVKGSRKLCEASNGPLYLNASDEDPRLQLEIALASGFSRSFSQTLHDLTQHSKDYPLDKRIQNCQYEDRLVSYYTEHGVPILMGLGGNLTGWNMPSYKNTLSVLQVLMSAEQGVKYFDPQVSNCMNIVQDVAANRALLRLLREYLDKYGYHDVTLLNRGYPFQGAWPRDVFQMAAVASLCVTTAVLQGVDVIRLRSLDESVATPTKEGNLLAIRIANQIIGSLKGQRMPESKELTLEQEMIEKEVRATVDKVIEVGDGDVARGMVKAVEHGILDCNFSPWIHYKGKVLLVRDKEGALRYLDRGNIPLPKEVVEYHREKIRERELAEHKKAGLEMVIRDVYQISNVSMKTP